MKFAWIMCTVHGFCEPTKNSYSVDLCQCSCICPSIVQFNIFFLGVQNHKNCSIVHLIVSSSFFSKKIYTKNTHTQKSVFFQVHWIAGIFSRFEERYHQVFFLHQSLNNVPGCSYVQVYTTLISFIAQHWKMNNVQRTIETKEKV